MSHVHVPSMLRRSGHQLSSTPPSPPRGFCGLPPKEAHSLRQGVQHLHALGARALAELLLELAEQRADLSATLATLDAWRGRLPVAMVNANGGDRFPPRPLRRVDL